ncbi:MAG TPA: B12-binding domain-containing radical SAM protein [Syntrophobacteraceae bacterium]|nr:B12-binding domain-containing radical SAM protein [Syntrophobacteraceae bacterium]
MKILLIQPCSDSQRWKGQKSHFGWPPLGLGYVAAATPPGHEVRVVDEAVESIDFDVQADLVGIGVMTPNSLRGYEIADEFRKRNRLVVIGGIHASMLPEEARQHADVVVIGEAENTWPQLLRDFRGGQLQGVYRAEPYVDLWDSPSPRRDLFKRHAYRFPSTVMATRGCPHGCSFCSTSKFFGRKYRKRNPANVAREIASLPDRLFIFVDDNLCFDREYSLDLLRLIIPLKKRWVCQVTLNIAEDDKLLAAMRKAGCIGVLLGIESINEHNIAFIGKGINVVTEYREKIRRIHREGIFVQGSFVFGFDNDDIHSFEPVLDFVTSTKLEAANFCILTPLPGTSIFSKFKAEGRLLHKDWSKYDRLNVVYQPSKLSASALQDGIIRCYLRTYSHQGILRRLPWLSRRILMALAFNLSYRKGAYGQWK